MRKQQRNPGGRGRVGKNYFVTKSGNTVKLNRGLGERMKARKDFKAQQKAAYLSTLPKGRIKRFFARLHPKRLAKYWFSRQGGIMALKIMGIGTVAGFLMLVGLFAYFRKDLPKIKDIAGKNIGGSIRYYDKTGQTLLWEDYDAVKRIPVKDDAISKYVKDATVAVEDKDFFHHGGFDVRGIARAGVSNIKGGGSTQGGSTLTQQLVKITQNWTNERSYTRKIKELILAVELERSYSKQEILTGYLNAAPYGNVQYGVEAASRDYFDKSAKDLTLSEAAFLASIPKSPSCYSPYGAFYKENPEDCKAEIIGRNHYVLDLMHQQGLITTAQRDEAKKVDVLATVKEPRPKFSGIKAPYFVMAAKNALVEKYCGKTTECGGWNVTTTLDLKLQQIAEEQVQKALPIIRSQKGDTAAFAAEDVTNGQMVAMVGGANFFSTNPNDSHERNFAQEVKLPPGSSFKPYDYLSLMEHTTNFGAGSVLYDTQGPIDGYACTVKTRPKNDPKANCLWDYDFRYPGPVSLRYALGGSRNVPAVKAMNIVGVDKTIQTAEKLGLTSGYKCYPDDETLKKEGQCYPSSSIGDGAYLHLDEHVHAYGTISRNGLAIDQTYILKITDANNKIIDEWKPKKGNQVVRADAAYIVADMMSDPNASYFPANRKPHRYKDWKFAMKTGTTNDNKDGWMMGFSTKYAAGVWVGHNSRRVEMSGTMENMTQPIWHNWMKLAHDGIPAVERPKPAGVQTLPAYVVRSHVGIGSVEPSPATDLFPSWYKQPSKKTGGNKTFDQVSNKLATSCTPERAKKQINDADANTFSGDPYVNRGAAGANANTAENDDVHKCEDSKPSITITATGCNVVATVSQGTHPLSSAAFPGVVGFTVGGQTAQSFGVSDSPSTVSYTAPPGTTQVAATVIDSVLYDATDTVNLDCAGGGSGGLTILTPTEGQDVNTPNPSISWSGGAAPYTVKINGIIQATCSGASTSCSPTIVGPNGTSYSLAITDNDGVTKSLTFTR